MLYKHYESPTKFLRNRHYAFYFINGNTESQTDYVHRWQVVERASHTGLYDF